MSFIIIYSRPLEASLAAGWCSTQPLNLASFYLFRIAACWMICPVVMFSLSRHVWGGKNEKEVGWSGEKWASFHLCHPHQASACPQLFEASLIQAFRIKPMKKKRIKSDRVTEGDILGENRLLWNMLRNSFALTHNATSEGNLCDTFFSDQGLAIGFAWIGKRTLWSHGCKGFWSFSEN